MLLLDSVHFLTCNLALISISSGENLCNARGYKCVIYTDYRLRVTSK